VQPGDNVIIISYAMMSKEEYDNHTPTVVIVDEMNKPVNTEYREVHAAVL
ncbi:aspartate 1-decarboxylase, partial [Clostridium perfringens]